MATQPFDADALRADLGNVTVPSPTDAAAAGDGGAPPAPEPPPAEPGDEPKPADQAASGSTLGDQPPPASDTSAHDAWVKRYGDPEKAAQEAFAVEKRAAAQAKRIKELEARTEPEPGSTPEEPADLLGLEPEFAEPDEGAGQPAPVAVPPAVAQAIQKAEADDPECKALGEQYHALGARRDEILQRNGMGQVVGGALVQLDERIYRMNSLIQTLDNPENAAAILGLNELGEFERAEVVKLLPQRVRALKTELRDLRDERRDLVDELNTTIQRRTDLSERYDKRSGLIRDHFLGPVRDAAQRKAEIELVKVKGEEFTREWRSAFDGVCTALQIPPEDKDLRRDLFSALKTAALAHPGAIHSAELPRFMETHAKNELEKLDRYHRLKSATYADSKRRVLVPTAGTTPTPGQPQASDKIDLQSLDDALRADLRAGLRKTARV